MRTYIRRDDVKDWRQVEARRDTVAEFVFVSIDDAERHWDPAEETFPFYELVYVFSGRLVMWLDGTPLEGTKGDVFIVKPGVPHREESPPGSTCRLLCLATGFKGKGGRRRRFPLDLPDKVHLGAGHLVEQNLLAIANEAYHRREGYAAAISSHTIRIFIEIAREAQNVTMPRLDIGEIRRRRLARDARRFIEENYSAPLSLAEIAQHFFMSPYHFARVFKRTSGISPMAYLARVRMDNAKRLLLDPQRPVKAVAAEVGYDDPHYFCKVFTRHEGVSPTAYRRRHLPPS